MKVNQCNKQQIKIQQTSIDHNQIQKLLRLKKSVDINFQFQKAIDILS